MTFQINGIEIPTTDINNRIARDTVNTFLEVVRKGVRSSDNDALFITILLMMYKRSGELLDELGADNIIYIMEQFKRKTSAMTDTEGA